jgi:hypothetical protein
MSQQGPQEEDGPDEVVTQSPKTAKKTKPTSMADIAKLIQSQTKQARDAQDQAVQQNFDNLPPLEKLSQYVDSKDAVGMMKVLEVAKDVKDINTAIGFTLDTVLQIAAERGHFDAGKHLLSIGANKNLYDHKGYLPSHLAEREGHQNIAKYLDPNFEATIPRISRTTIHLLGEWQSEEDTASTMRFRKDLTARFGTGEYQWHPGTFYEATGLTTIPISRKAKDIGTKESLTHIGASANSIGSNVTFKYQNDDLLVKKGDTFERFIRVSVEDDDLIRRERGKGEKINFSIETRYQTLH